MPLANQASSAVELPLMKHDSSVRRTSFECVSPAIVLACIA